LLSATGVLMIFGASLPPLLNAVGRPDVNLKYALACTLLYPPCFVVAGLWGGLVGICMVWLVLYPLILTVLLRLTKPQTGVGPLALLRVQLPVLAAVAFMVLAVWLTQSALARLDQVGVRLAFTIVVGVLAYAGWLLATARRTVLADLRGLLRDLRGK
jgi:hypothetical protein